MIRRLSGRDEEQIEVKKVQWPPPMDLLFLVMQDDRWSEDFWKVGNDVPK